MIRRSTGPIAQGKLKIEAMRKESRYKRVQTQTQTDFEESDEDAKQLIELKKNEKKAIAKIHKVVKEVRKETLELIAKALFEFQRLEATSKRVLSNVSFINGSVLLLALHSTLNFDSDNTEFVNLWIAFSIVWFASLLFAVLPRCFESEQEIKRELHLVRGEEPDALHEKFEDVLLATLSLAMSLSHKDAAAAVYGLWDLSEAYLALVTLAYSLILITFGIFVVVRIGACLKLRKAEVIARFDTERVQKAELIRFALLQSLYKLIQSFFRFAVAWSWRDCLNALVTAIVGSTEEYTQWTYFFVVLAFVSLASACSKRFRCIPTHLKTQQQHEAYLKGATRKEVGLLIDANLKVLLGLALLDALNATLQNHEDIDSAVLCALYWVTAVGGSVISIIGAHYLSQRILKYVASLFLSLSLSLSQTMPLI